jgi:diphosphomevalonate decarboxylase
MSKKASAIAHPNIAFIKYWGNTDDTLRIPANGSISMNLDGLETRTTVMFDPSLDADTLILNQTPVTGAGLERVSQMLARVRAMAEITSYAHVVSENNFPTGSGIASSAAAFAALALASSSAAGLELDKQSLSILARTGSGSASRSIPGGFVEWLPGDSHETSYARTFAPLEHWPLADCVAVVSQAHKTVGSTGGHSLADTSPFQTTRVQDAPRRLEICRRAILERDFAAFAGIIELDSNMMHAVMQTSTPPLMYWQPATLAVMSAVQEWRKTGSPVAYTIDAGPNVHVICPEGTQQQTAERLMEIPGVIQILQASAGGPARLID